MTASRTVFLDTALSNYQSLAAQYGAGSYEVVLLDAGSPHAGQIQNWLGSHQLSAADVTIVSASDSVNGFFTPRVVFVDSSVANVEQLIAGMPANATVVLLDSSRDGLQQIHDYLAATAGKVGAVDIVSHGAPGELMIGSTVLNAANLASYGSQLAAIGSHMTADADLLLYGCDVASGPAGQQFIAALAAATGADVAASTDQTGAAAAGGDWVLEASTGTIETAALNIADYQNLLAQTISDIKILPDTGIDPADLITKDTVQTVTFSVVGDNSAIWVSIDGGTRTQAVLLNRTGGKDNYSVQVNTVSTEGKHTIQFWEKSTGTGQITTKDYTLDKTPPVAGTLSFNDLGDSGVTGDGITNDNTFSLALSGNEAGSTVRYEYALNGSSTFVSTTAAQNALADGSYQFRARVTDVAGNESVTNTIGVTIITAKPGAPSITGFADNSGSSSDTTTNDNTPTFTIKALADAKVEVFEGGVSLGIATQTAAHSGIYTLTTPKLADGSHSFTAFVTDAAGNTSAASPAQAVIVDTTLTAPTIVLAKDSGRDGSDGVTNDASLTFNKADGDATRVITVDGNKVGAYDPKALGDGNHTVVVTDTDVAGNTASATLTFTLDTTAPAAGSLGFSGLNDSGVQGDGITNDRDFTLALTGNEAGSTVAYEVSVDGGAFHSTGATQAGLADGNYQFRAIVTDAAGNSATTAAVGVKIDATAPGTPSITAFSDNSGSKGDTITNDNTPTLTITAEADSTVQVFRGGVLVGTATQTAPGSGIYSFTSETLADGSHDFSAKATDAAGNTSAASSVQNVTVDTTPPVPTVALAKDSGASGTDKLTNDASLNFGSLEAGASRVITVDGTEVSSYNAAALKDGEHTVTVADTDAAGNTGSASITFMLDTKLSAPTVVLATDSGKDGSDGLTNDASLTFSKADSDATRVITVDGTKVDSYNAAALADGKHTVTVTDTDGAGNTATASVVFTLDTAAPTTSVALNKDSGTSSTDKLTNDASLNFGTLEEGATRVITVDGTKVDVYNAAALKDGEHTVTVADTDVAGNTGSASITFTLDTKLSAPTVVLATDSGKDGSDGLTNDASLTFSKADSDATRVITVDGTKVDSYNAAALADGKHTVTVTDTDAAGNTATASVVFTLDTTAPTTSVALSKDSGTSSTDKLTNDASLNFGSLEAGASRVIKVDGTEVSGYNPAALQDGEHTVTVSDTDVAGNTGSASITFTLDTKLSAPTVVLANDSGKDGSDGLTNDASLTFSKADSDATRVITVDGTKVDSYNAASLADGKHTVTVTDTDGAGNTATASVVFTLDTAAPTTSVALSKDSGTSGTDKLTNDASMNFGTLEEGATRVITVDGSKVDVYNAAALKDGEHTVTVADTDAAGNTGSASITFTLDTKLSAPTVALANDSGKDGSDGLTNDAHLTFSKADSDATRVITVDGTKVDSYNAAALADGKHTVTVTDTDAAGNTATASVVFTLDTAAPTTSVALSKDSGTSGTDKLTNDASLNFGTLEAGASRVITVDGTKVDVYNAAALKDGEHTVTVADTDAAGNTGSASVTFTLDTKLSAPTVALANDSGKDGSDGLTNDASLTFGKADSDATRVITVDGTKVDSYNAAVLTDGKHTVTVTDTDGAGNTATASVVFTLDTAVPTTSVALNKDSGASNTDKLTNDASLNFGTLEEGATRVITVDGSKVDVYNAAALKDGEHTVTVADTDAAGNTGSASITFTLDTKLSAPTVALANDSGKDGSDGLTNDAHLTFSKADSDATRVITVDGTKVDSYNAAALADGKHTVTVTDTDAAGNTATASVVFTLDTAAPTTSVALSKDSGTSSTDKLTNDASLNFGTLEEGATRVITVDGTKVDVYNAAALKDGEHTVTVADTDAAGNTGSASITFMLDTTAPNAGTLGFSGLNDSGVQGDGITNDRDFTLALTGNDAGSTVAYEVSVDGGAFHSTGATQAGLADGNYQFRAIVTDAAGNSATTAAVSVKIDATAPGAPSITAFSDNSGSKGDTITNDNTPTLTITAEADSTVQVFRGGVLVGTATQTAPGSGIYSFTSETLADGSHDFSAKATDAAGNTSAASSVQNVTVDTTPPVPTVALAKDSGASGTDKLTNDASLNFGSLEAGASRVITVDGTKVDVYNAAALKDGEHTVTVSDTDVAGNTGSASITFTLDTKLSAPTVVLANDSGKDGSDGLTNDASLTFSKPDSDATRVITVDGTKVDSYNAASLADGKHTVTVTDTDGAGNTATASVVFTLDTAVPTTSVALNKDSGASNTDKLTNDASLNFGSLEAGASRVITVDGSKVDVYDAAALKDGQHTVTVADTDAAGNTGSKSFTFTLDSQGPVFSSAAGASVAENIGERQVVYRAAAGDDHGVSYSLGGADAARFEIAADGSVTLKENPNYEVKDAYAFTVVATDGAGNHTDRPVVLSIGNVNEAPVATSVAAWTIESAAIGVQIANYVSDPDAGDKLSVQLASNTATLSWANTDAKMSTSLLNPVTHAAVDLGSLTVKASMGADGQLTLTPPAELDWLSDGQFVKASFSYTVTDAGGLSSSESITLLIKGSTNATGVNLSGGNGDDTLSGDANNNAADVLMGNNGNDTLYGYGGTDALYGGNGDDKLYGGAGIDYLYGDNGNDTLDGGSEGDYLFGGKGNDILIGGSGADKFVFAPQNGNDRIMDFNAAEGDMLYFADFFATPPTVDAFLSKYVTDIGSDLQINLTGTTIVLVGVANISDLKGHIAFGNPA